MAMIYGNEFRQFLASMVNDTRNQLQVIVVKKQNTSLEGSIFWSSRLNLLVWSVGSLKVKEIVLRR